MQLAADEITIRLDHEEFHLRPTLRAALRLERKHGGFDALARAVADGNLSVIADVIRESADGFTSLPAFLERVSQGGLHRGLDVLLVPVLAHVFALAGYDEKDINIRDRGEDQSENKAQTGVDEVERTTFAEHHAKLFRIATGWLGWTPAEAWSSTPAEILAAYNGRIELLKAVFGGSDQDADPTANLSLDDKARLVMASFGAKRVQRGTKAD